jgi:hypothetical protein
VDTKFDMLLDPDAERSELQSLRDGLTLLIQAIETSRHPNRPAGLDGFHAPALGASRREDIDG